MREFQEIIDTTPLSLARLNDQLRLLWDKSRNITGKDIRFNTISANQIVVGENASFSQGVQSKFDTIDNKVEPSGVVSIVNGIVTADYIYALGVTANRVTTLGSGHVLADLYQDTYGGNLKIYNNSGLLVSAIGVESGTGSNRNGTFILFDGSPYDYSPYSDQYRRVEAGISKSDSAGLLNLRDASQSVRIELSASARRISIRDASENVKTWFTETSGYINSEMIATQSWVQSNQSIPSTIATQTNVGYGGATIDGSGGTLRLRSCGGNTTVSCQSDGNIVFYYSGTAMHAFRSDGTKMGGSIKIDDDVWGMSPIDSPKVLISDLIENVEATADGTIVVLDEKLSKALNSYSVFHSGGNIEITNKTKNSFVVKGNGTTDLLVIGHRAGSESVNWTKMPKLDDMEIAEKQPTSNRIMDVPVNNEESFTVQSVVLGGIDIGGGE